MRKRAFIFIILSFFLISACGGSSTDSNTSIGSSIPAGGTPFAGTWNIVANIAVFAGSNETNIIQTSTILVGGNGVSAISSTDATGALTVNFNGSSVGYQTTLLVANGVEGAAPCSLTIAGTGNIVGVDSVDNSALSGSFGSETFICNGAAVTLSGNFSGSIEPTESVTPVDPAAPTT